MSETNEKGMTTGDAMAELERSLPVLSTKPKELYETKQKLMPPGPYVIAVSSEAIARNQRATADGYPSVSLHPLVELYQLTETGLLKDARFVGTYRHVEVLGASWLYHDPEDSLQHNHKRSSVLRTDSALRVYADTYEQSERVRLGC